MWEKLWLLKSITSTGRNEAVGEPFLFLLMVRESKPICESYVVKASRFSWWKNFYSSGFAPIYSTLINGTSTIFPPRCITRSFLNWHHSNCDFILKLNSRQTTPSIVIFDISSWVTRLSLFFRRGVDNIL